MVKNFNTFLSDFSDGENNDASLMLLIFTLDFENEMLLCGVRQKQNTNKGNSQRESSLIDFSFD